MRAAIVSAAGQAPTLGQLAAPAASTGEKLIEVSAAAISHIVKARASGAHYSAGELFPFVVGIDGVGRLKPGETVLINGATSTSGRLAVQIARLLGAGRIIAAGRNVKALAEAQSLGADVTIQLDEDGEPLERRFMQEFAQGVDIVIDYLWGLSAECLLIAAAKAGRDAVPMRFVQMGSMSAPDITLPSAVLRASAIELMGSSIGSIPVPRLIEISGEVLRATAPNDLRIAFKPVPFGNFDQAWPLDDSTCRTVFAMNTGGA